MNDFDAMTKEIESLKADLAAKKAKADAVKDARDSKERATLASQHELQKLFKETLDHQLASGYVNPKVAQAALKASSNVELDSVGLLYDLIHHPVTGADLGAKGLIRWQGKEYDNASHLEQDLAAIVGLGFPAGWLNRMAYAKANSESDAPLLIRRQALEAAMKGLPQPSSDLLWTDQVAYNVAMGNDPIGAL